MKVEQLTCSIGAELTCVRLADALHDEGLFAEIRQACSAPRCCSCAIGKSPAPSMWRLPEIW